MELATPGGEEEAPDGLGEEDEDFGERDDAHAQEHARSRWRAWKGRGVKYGRGEPGVAADVGDDEGGREGAALDVLLVGDLLEEDVEADVVLPGAQRAASESNEGG